jgi:hypothetical protein
MHHAQKTEHFQKSYQIFYIEAPCLRAGNTEGQDECCDTKNQAEFQGLRESS